MKVPKISNPNEFVEVQVEDKGELMPAYDAAGQPYEAYMTYFEFNDLRAYSIVDKERCHRDGAGNAADNRFKADCDFLRAHDLDLAKAEL